MKNLNLFIGSGWDYSGYGCGLQELKSLDNGPIKGSYVINGVLYGLDFLSKNEYPKSCIVSINKGASYYPGEFSGLIDVDFKEVRHDFHGSITHTFIEIAEEDLKNENDLSLDLALLNESNEAEYFAIAQEKYLKELGYDVSLEKGYIILSEE